MLVPIVYRDETHDMVKPMFLESLIRSRKILRFHRVDGWIDVDSGPLRKGPDFTYVGPERRSESSQTLW